MNATKRKAASLLVRETSRALSRSIEAGDKEGVVTASLAFMLALSADAKAKARRRVLSCV